MTTITNGGWGRRVVAAVGAVTIAMIGAVALAAPASATETPNGPNIDPKAKGSVTIHKYAEPDQATGLPYDGTKLTAEQLKNLTPLQGVTFSIAQVDGIDLTTNAGWTTAATLTVKDGKVTDGTTTFATSNTKSGATGLDGVVDFSQLPLGVYLVTEGDPGANPIAISTPPFLVTVPLATQKNTWLYDVNVYPKNSLTGVTKTVDDAKATGLGSEISWTVAAQIPNVGEGRSLNRFEIVDTLDARLGYAGASVAVTDRTGAPVTLSDGSFTVTAPATGAAGDLKVVFTEKGLAELQAKALGGTVTATVKTTVKEIGDGSIENTVTLYVNDATVVSEDVTSWGALKVFKYAKSDRVETGLKDAEFQVFTSEADATARTSPVSVDGKTTFVSDASGNLTVDGLFAGVKGTGKDYWVVETKAPVGYTADLTPIKVTVKPGSIADAQIVKVLNTQVPPPILPLTGGDGAVVFGIAGVALVLIAAGAAVVIARRRVRV